MHYYRRNIGDYHKKAGKLSMLQHGAYTLLIDACYDREKFPTFDEALEWCWAESPEEISSVQFVLKKFFDLIDGQYIQSRIFEELENYQVICTTNKEIALNREEEKRTKRARSVHEPITNHHLTTNHKPLTTNQEPKEKKKKEMAIKPDGVDDIIFADFLKIRKAKKAPLTETAMLGIVREAGIANITLQDALKICCERGWQSFKADWVKPVAVSTPQPVKRKML